jgi:hypothetical protein
MVPRVNRDKDRNWSISHWTERLGLPRQTTCISIPNGLEDRLTAGKLAALGMD